MKTFWKVVGIAALLAVLGVATVGAVALAQEPEDGSIGPFNFREKVHEAIADLLGISVEEYDAAIETAQTQVIDEAMAEGWLTEDQAERLQERFDEGFGEGFDRGMMPKGLPRQGGQLVPVAAEELDMTVRELMAELQDGKSIADVAEEAGVDPQTITDAFLAQLTEKLDASVEEGRITQKQADWMLGQAEEQVQEQLYQVPDFENLPQRDLRHGGGMPGFFPGRGDL
jgi:hypothetical protein